VFDSCLVAHYPFNGNANDVVYDNNGAVEGASLTVDRFGVDSAAYSFDGINDFILVPNSPQINPQHITLCVWYKTVSFEGVGNNAIIDKPYDSHDEPYYQYHIGVVGDQYTNNAYSRFQTDLTVDSLRVKHYTEDNFWTIGEWYFLCSSFDGHYYRTYINGVLFDSTYNPGTITSYNRNLFFGKFGNKESHTPGVIDDVRIYSCALDQESITVLYNADYTSVDIVESNPEVIVYPNPTSESIIIESDSKIGKITLSNIFGSIVLKQGLTSNIINLSDCKAGVYMLQVFDKKGGLIAVEKIIKK